MLWGFYPPVAPRLDDFTVTGKMVPKRWCGCLSLMYREISKLSVSLNRFPGTKPRGGFHLPPTYSPNASAASYFELFSTQAELGVERLVFGDLT